MARIQILVHRWGPEQGFRRCFEDGLNQKLVSTVAQATASVVFVDNRARKILIARKATCVTAV